MAKKNKERKNIVFVTIFIGTMLLFMFGTVAYVTSQVANCSSVKKVRKMCSIESERLYSENVKAGKLPWKRKS